MIMMMMILLRRYPLVMNQAPPVVLILTVTKKIMTAAVMKRMKLHRKRTLITPRPNHYRLNHRARYRYQMTLWKSNGSIIITFQWRRSTHWEVVHVVVAVALYRRRRR